MATSNKMQSYTRSKIGSNKQIKKMQVLVITQDTSLRLNKISDVICCDFSDKDSDMVPEAGLEPARF